MLMVITLSYVDRSNSLLIMSLSIIIINRAKSTFQTREFRIRIRGSVGGISAAADAPTQQRERWISALLARANMCHAPPKPSLPSKDARSTAGEASALGAACIRMVHVRAALSGIPAEAGGIALNLAGMGSWLSALCELHPAMLPAFDASSGVVVSLSCTILIAIGLQVLLHNAHFCGEVRKPKQCGSLGGLLMALTLCCSYTSFIPGAGQARRFDSRTERRQRHRRRPLAQPIAPFMCLCTRAPCVRSCPWCSCTSWARYSS